MPTALSPQAAADVEYSIEHFNANHADTVLLIARYAAGCEAALDAEAVAVDTEGVDFTVRLADGPTAVRMSFEAPVTSSMEVQAQVMSWIGVARATAGEGVPITSMESEMSKQGTIATFYASVTAVRPLTPNLREIVVEGDFDGFESLGDDQFMYVFVGRDGPLPDGYDMVTYLADDPETRPFGAYYTVRSWDPDAGRMTMWFVVHGHGDGVGGWSARCEPGERIALWGSRASFARPDDAAVHLFVADESGFAAVAARVDDLPDDAETIVIVETIDEDHTLELVPPGRADVRWVFRGDDEPGTGTRLLDAVRLLDLDRPGMVAFGAGESRQVSAIRRLLRRDHGFGADHVSMTGYWRRVAH